MYKIMVAALSFSLMILLSCNKPQPPTNESTANKTEPPAATAGPNTVTILLSGLMVFHKEKGKDTYEVGILSSDDHAFNVSVNGISLHGLEKFEHLKLMVIPEPHVSHENHHVGHRGRRPDNSAGRWDFSWIIDLKKELHSADDLTLKPGKLRPIFHLPAGKFFTLYKSLDLQLYYNGDENNAVDFGFVPETIALSVRLNPNEKLVLRDRDDNEIVLVDHKPPDPPNLPGHVVLISNQRAHPFNGSDFSKYYDLFVTRPSKVYDFAQKEEAIEEPLNPYPGYGAGNKKDEKALVFKPALTTCCMMACTAVLLDQEDNLP